MQAKAVCPLCNGSNHNSPSKAFLSSKRLNSSALSSQLDTPTVKSAHQINICRGNVTCANASSDHRQRKLEWVTQKWPPNNVFLEVEGKKNLDKFTFIKAYERSLHFLYTEGSDPTVTL